MISPAESHKARLVHRARRLTVHVRDENRPYVRVFRIEAGKRTPSLDIVERLASAIGVEYKSLFEPNDSPHASPADDFSRHLLESKLIAAVTDTIRREFMG